MATSRVCVKGLPKHVTDDKLRKFFAERGEITDAKVMRSKDGRSRQFGFVGFRTILEAEQAVKYYNRSFMDTCRLTVEAASQYGSSQLGRPWSKHSAGSSTHKRLADDQGDATAHDNTHPFKKTKVTVPEEAEDPKLEEFLQVMQPRHKTAMWANSDLPTVQQGPPAQSAASSRKQTKKAVAVHAGSSSEHTPNSAKMHQSQPEAPAQDATLEQGMESDDTAGPDMRINDPEDAAVSDLAYLKSRIRSKLDDSDEELPEGVPSPRQASVSDHGGGSHASDQASEDRSQPEDVVSQSDEQQTQEGMAAGDAERRAGHARAGPSRGSADSASAVELVQQTGRLFARNLPFSVTEGELAELFQIHGQLSEVHLVQDRMTGQARGIALVQFEEPQNAVAALQALDGSIFQGRLLHLLPARQAPQALQSEHNQVDARSGFKAAKAQQQRDSAGNRAAWNALFMRPDTVAQAIAAHYNVSKADLLDRDASDLPVRMALGETHVIALTKAALAEAGVDVAALEAAAAAGGKKAGGGGQALARSQTTLIVKNLPFSASQRELQDLFGKVGQVLRLVLPPTRTLAIVELTDKKAAQQAFRTLAYKAFHHVPLFLEWAPEGIWASAAALASDYEQAGPEAANHPLDAATDAEGASAASTTIFVKNLAFGTADAALRKHFDAVVSAAGGVIRSAIVQKSQSTAAKKGAKALSAGYGFVECSSEDVAKAVMRRMQGSLLDAHKLQLQLSMRKHAAAQQGESDTSKAHPGKGKALGTKLVVRNVAFEAARKDIAALFSPFGHFKSCRLPRKYDGTHRGFAFVDFLTKQEAQHAAEAVTGTHLYGRRLVVEWAKQDDALNDIRAKTAAKFHHAG